MNMELRFTPLLLESTATSNTCSGLGDIYRRGKLDGKRNAKLALEAYHLSEDPYAWYRIGQSYEEGWVDAPDLDKAMIWFNKAAAVGHHLAIKRLTTNENETQY